MPSDIEMSDSESSILDSEMILEPENCCQYQAYAEASGT